MLPITLAELARQSSINSPTERRLAVVRLHSEGWSITPIAAYLQVNRKTVYATLQRWAEEEFAGLPDKSKARKGPRKVTLKVRNEIRIDKWVETLVSPTMITVLFGLDSLSALVSVLEWSM